jgi:glycosyltransferase involved in cell wall biosynthesis
MSKVKVLFIMHLPPPIHGAAIMGNFVKNSAAINGMVDAVYINLATNTKLGQTGKAGFKKLLTFLRLVNNVFLTLLRKRFDLCHMSLTSTGGGFYKDVVIVALVKLSGARLIYHFHNKGIRNASGNSINRTLYRFVFKNSKVILLSPYLYPDISQYVSEADVFYCPNGIPEISKPLNGEPRKAGFDQPCKLLYFSNMMNEKGAYVLLNALKELKARNLDFGCDFVGGWSDITEKEFNHKIAESGLSKIVTAHGPKYGDDKEAFFGNADVFIFPTFYHYEAFPIVNLEAMQHGLPVVSTPEGGIRDIITNGKTGFMVPQRDSTALADKLEILVQDPGLRKQMGEAGKRKFESSFTLKHFENRLVEILKQASSM